MDSTITDIRVRRAGIKTFPKSKKKNTKGKRQNSKNMALGVPTPNFTFNPIYSKVFRFSLGTTETKGNTNITAASLQGLMFAGRTSTTAYNLFSGVRLKYVKIWAPPQQNTTIFTEVQIEWSGDRSPDTTIMSMGTATTPAFIRSAPPKGSFAAMWYDRWNSQYNPTLFTILSNYMGAIIEIAVDFTLLDIDPQDMANQMTVALSGTASAGVVYYNYLDSCSQYGVSGSAATGSNQWIPIGPNQILSAYF